MRFKEGHPIIIGLCGAAGTGKTVTAEYAVPSYSAVVNNLFWWDHKFLASPLYSLANIRRNIDGFKAEERMKYEIHNVLFNLFGESPLYGLPDYDKFVSLVYEILNIPISLDGKPRTFLQTAGSLCRGIDQDVFVKHMIRSIKKDNAWAAEFKIIDGKEEEPRQYICIVSDIRMPNEAEAISSQPNGIVIKLEASEEVRKKRLFNRDGFLMTPEQANHESEKIDDIPDEFISNVLNTDQLTVNEQGKTVIDIASKLLGIELILQTQQGELANASY